MNVPRGPSGIRRPGPESVRSSRVEAVRGDRVSDRERRKRDKAKGVEIKTTMTDFRIVGIEVKELGWSWGLVGEDVRVKKEECEEKTPEPEKSMLTTGDDVKEEVEEEEEEEEEEVEEVEEVEGLEEGEKVKTEAQDGDADVVEEKRGEKRKAKTPDPGLYNFPYIVGSKLNQGRRRGKFFQTKTVKLPIWSREAKRKHL